MEIHRVRAVYLGGPLDDYVPSPYDKGLLNKNVANQLVGTDAKTTQGRRPVPVAALCGTI
jgi:hypothetical protein